MGDADSKWSADKFSSASDQIQQNQQAKPSQPVPKIAFMLQALQDCPWASE